MNAGSGHLEFSQSLANCYLLPAQTSCIFRSAHIALHLNVRNEDVISGRIVLASSWFFSVNTIT